MYSSKPNLLIGFHGCEKSEQQKLINDSKYFKKSQESYDWLGHGMYFWDGNVQRAMEWAKIKQKAGKLKEPAVVGAVIDLGRCLDLLDSGNINALEKYYQIFKHDVDNSGLKIPQNKDYGNNKGDKVLRYLDCAVIEYMHKYLEFEKQVPFDSVRAAFIEGDPIYPNAGFNKKTHIQICIINPNCIKGVFLPRIKNESFGRV